MKKEKIVICGKTPLLMFNLDLSMDKSNMSDKDKAQTGLYKNSSGQIGICGADMQNAINRIFSFGINGEKRFAKIKKWAKRNFRVEDKFLPLISHSKMTIDKRCGVVGGRKIYIVRPRFDNWEIEFTLLFNDKYYNTDDVLNIMNKVGEYSGIGSFAPRTKGWYGKFCVKK